MTTLVLSLGALVLALLAAVQAWLVAQQLIRVTARLEALEQDLGVRRTED